MVQFIDDCLKPLYKFKWLDTLVYEDVYLRSIVFYVAYSDNRLIR